MAADFKLDFAGTAEEVEHGGQGFAAVKTSTGNPTSVLIAERIVAEAKALLQHSDRDVADIAYKLGFEYPTYFNNHFKRRTGTSPQAFRKV